MLQRNEPKPRKSQADRSRVRPRATGAPSALKMFKVGVLLEQKAVWRQYTPDGVFYAEFPGKEPPVPTAVWDAIFAAIGLNVPDERGQK